jgi:hypothetical protein
MKRATQLTRTELIISLKSYGVRWKRKKRRMRTMRLEENDREAGGRGRVGGGEWKRTWKGKGEEDGKWERSTVRAARENK